MCVAEKSGSDWLHHNDWARWFAISSPSPICYPSFNFMGGVAKNKNN